MLNPLAPNVSFNRLIGLLDGVDFAKATDDAVETILALAQIDGKTLAPFVRFAAGRYTRNGVYRSRQYELIVMCWPANVGSPIHDHGGSRGFVKVLRGSLNIQSYTVLESDHAAQVALLQQIGERALTSGEIERTTPSADVHAVGAGARDAVSLHLYAKPLETFRVFNLGHRSYVETGCGYDIAPAVQVR